jgi:hypothetical protein
MSQNVTLFGTTYAIPEVDERNWGNTVTNFLVKVGNGLDGAVFLTSTDKALTVAEITVSTVADAATFTATTPVHRISGDGGAATLDGTTAITDGQVDGQYLEFIGNSDANTVTIDDAANTKMNGQVILTLGDVIRFRWDSTASVWQELGRNN